MHALSLSNISSFRKAIDGQPLLGVIVAQVANVTYPLQASKERTRWRLHVQRMRWG